MPSKTEHLDNEFKLYGTRSPEVHEDLDELFKYHGLSHRAFRHHLEYVLKQYSDGRWNTIQVRAALLHLQDDNGKIMLEENWR